MEELLHRGREGVHRIEYRGKVHKKHCEHAPEVLHIAEEYEQRRKDKTDTEIEYDHADYRDYQHKERPVERYAVNDAEDEEDSESKPEVDKRRNVL